MLSKVKNAHAVSCQGRNGREKCKTSSSMVQDIVKDVTMSVTEHCEKNSLRLTGDLLRCLRAVQKAAGAVRKEGHASEMAKHMARIKRSVSRMFLAVHDSLGQDPISCVSMENESHGVARSRSQNTGCDRLKTPSGNKKHDRRTKRANTLGRRIKKLVG